MKSAWLCILLLGAPGPALAAGSCRPEMLRAETLGLIKPLMELRIKQSGDQFSQDGRWRGVSPVAPEIERRLQALLENRTAAGDEALAFLLNVYLGEYPGEELVCEVTNRGGRMLPLIDAYARCTPLTGLEPFPKFVRGSGTLPGTAKRNILRGRKCRYEN